MDDVKGLGFCISVKHAEYMAHYFNEHEIPSLALSTKSNDSIRDDAKRQLVKGEIKFIFVVDLYNEGVDIPEVNTVLFLRPTESATVFLQQLGRGLRLSEGKECLTVLDFVGRANKKYKFDIKYESLVGKGRKSLQKQVDEGFSNLPRGCFIEFEKKAKEYRELSVLSLAGNNGIDKSFDIYSEMIAADEAAAAEKASIAASAGGDTVFQRKYMLPFFISLAVLVCNQAIGFNAIQYFSIPMFMKAGLSQTTANAANLIVWLVPIPVTALALSLVDRCGRKILLKAGTLGMTAALVGVATLFLLIDKGMMAGGPAAGWSTVGCIALFVASFSIGPGVVVWLALSELMPGRIRANGMAVALFVNQMVAFAIADVFLPWQKACGYAVVFYSLAGFAFLYFITAAFLLPETKGKTLEEIEAYFAGKKSAK
jgi:hypothetical protein